MSAGARIALVAIVASLAACGSVNRAGPTAAAGGGTGTIGVESRPGGAMISVDGTQQGASPVGVRVELDATGRLLHPLEIAADFSVSNPVRGVAHVVTARFNRGESPPRQLVLARPSDGGIQRMGSFVPGM